MKIETIKRTRSISVTVSSIVCLYVLFVKAYKICYDIYNRYFDIIILVTDLVILISCILILYSLWKKKRIIIKYRFIYSLVILCAIFIQIFLGLFTFLASDPRINQFQLAWLVHVPNILSLIILVYTLVAYCFPSRP